MRLDVNPATTKKTMKFNHKYTRLQHDLGQTIKNDQNICHPDKIFYSHNDCTLPYVRFFFFLFPPTSMCVVTKPMYTSHAKYRKDGVTATHLKASIRTQCHYLSERRRKGAQSCREGHQLSEQDPSSPHFHSILIFQSEHTIKSETRKPF